MQAFIPGLYARSEALVQSTRDLDRGRTTPEAVDEQVGRDQAELVSAQQAAGLDLLADGMLRWQDVFRPLVEAADGLETGALTRFLDTNTFYRAPSATTDAPKLGGPLGEEYVAPLPGPRIVTLPSPFALAHGTGVTPKTMAEGVLKPALGGIDAELVVLEEPFLARDDQASPGDLADALDALSGGSKLALWLTFGDARTPARLRARRSARRCDRDRLLRDARRQHPRGLREAAPGRCPRCAQLGARGAAGDRGLRPAAPRPRSQRGGARSER